MKNPLQITLHDMNQKDAIEDLVREKFEKVKFMGLDVTKCHVVMKKLSKHHQKANLVSIRLDLKVAHFEDIVVTEHCPEDEVSLKSGLLKVFKSGLDLAHKHQKRRRDHHRSPLIDLPSVEPEEAEE